MGELEAVQRRHAIGPASADLERARRCFARREWAEAHRTFSRADQTARLAAEDLESLATSAYLMGLEAEYVQALERAHLAHLEAGAVQQAVRCVYWIAIQCQQMGP